MFLDTETGTVCTGSTQPACREFFAFPGPSTNNITRLRIGQPLIEIIDKCSNEFATKCEEVMGIMQRDHKQLWEQLTALREDNEWKGWYDLDDVAIASCEERFRDILEVEMPEDHSKIPVPVGNSRIISWAFWTSDFSRAPPCLRCQRLYQAWYLDKKPETPLEKTASLRNILKSSSAKQSREPRCCAESVAAAKIYALRTGNLALIH